jgi:calcineurin-like phosphoesterase family protein
MRIQLLSDLHLELAPGYHPVASTRADITVVAGDLGHSPDILERLAGWPSPILFVPGNHEYDHQDFDEAEEELRETASVLGMRYLNGDAAVIDGVRFLGVTRWCDFDLLGEDRREECMHTADYYFRVMGTARRGGLFGPAEAREVGLVQRAWLQDQLLQPFPGSTVVITHFGPSKRSADPRYGLAKSTAAFCNDDEDLIPLADLWLHGHLHCPHDYSLPNGRQTPTRVVCNPRGYPKRDEHLGFQEALVIDVPTRVITG